MLQRRLTLAICAAGLLASGTGSRALRGRYVSRRCCTRVGNMLSSLSRPAR